MSAKNTEATNMTMIRSTVSTPTSSSTSRDRSVAGRLLGGALLVGVLAAVALLAGWAERQGEAGRASETALRVLGGAIDAPVQAGDSFDVAIHVEGAEALAAFETTLRFDPKIVLPAMVVKGPFAPARSSLLNGGQPLQGELALGTYNAEGQTATGAGDLVVVTFEAVADGKAEVTLDPATTAAFDQVGQPIPARISLRVPGGPIYLPRLANGGE